MLANDTTEQKNTGGFALLVHAQGGVAELIAKCRRCGAITTHSVELAWRLRTLACSECNTSMRLGSDDLVGLRSQLVDARVRIDRLIDNDKHGRR